MSFGISIGDVLKLCEVASRVYKNCRDCTGEYKQLTREARNLTNLLGDICDKYDNVPESKKQQLLDALDSCVEVLHELDKTLLHYNSLDTRSQRTWARLWWDPEKTHSIRERLVSSVVILNSFYNTLICDSQVLVLEALKRLENDYKGGHREESIASVRRITSEGEEDRNDDDDDEAAWNHIIRDLEDVGITNHVALEYRMFIVDWFVRAVNEGRLLETCQQPQTRPTDPPSLFETGLFEEATPTETIVPRFEVAHRLRALSLNESPSEALPRIESDDASVKHGLSDRARMITAAWIERDFRAASVYLQTQLTEVERGATSTLSGRIVQPDRRLIRHLLGICASYSGDFQKAKELFDSVSSGMCAKRDTLDEGDIAAARWLGDSCLHLHEPYNTALAWSVALSGQIARHGEQKDHTQAVFIELAVLDKMLNSLRYLQESLEQGLDPTTVFKGMRIKDKLTLITWISNGLKHTYPPRNVMLNKHSPTTTLSWRATTAWGVVEELLHAPLNDAGSWPLPWDCTFLPVDAIIMEQYRPSLDPHSATVHALINEKAPAAGLTDAKQLDYVTRRGQKWLVETILKGLQELQIMHFILATKICCRLRKMRDGFAYDAVFCIKLKRVQLRRLHGVKISEAQWATRTVPPAGDQMFSGRVVLRNRADFLSVIQVILAKAENAENMKIGKVPLKELHERTLLMEKVSVADV